MKTFIGIVIASYLISPSVRADETLVQIFGESQAKQYFDLSTNADGKIAMTTDAAAGNHNEMTTSPEGTVLKIVRQGEKDKAKVRVQSKLITKPDGTQVNYTAYYNYYGDNKMGYPTGATLTDATYISADSKGKLVSIASCHGKNCMAMSADRCVSLKRQIEKLFPRENDLEQAIGKCGKLNDAISELISSAADAETRDSIKREMENMDPVAKNKGLSFKEQGVISNLETAYGWTELCASNRFSQETRTVKSH